MIPTYSSVLRLVVRVSVLMILLMSGSRITALQPRQTNENKPNPVASTSPTNSKKSDSENKSGRGTPKPDSGNGTKPGQSGGSKKATDGAKGKESGSPQITEFLPQQGPVGSQVTLKGTNLKSVTKVRLAGVDAPIEEPRSDTELTIQIPNGAVTGFIEVIFSNGNSSSPARFQVTQSQGGALPGNPNGSQPNVSDGTKSPDDSPGSTTPAQPDYWIPGLLGLILCGIVVSTFIQSYFFIWRLAEKIADLHSLLETRLRQQHTEVTESLSKIIAGQASSKNSEPISPKKINSLADEYVKQTSTLSISLHEFSQHLTELKPLIAMLKKKLDEPVVSTPLPKIQLPPPEQRIQFPSQQQPDSPVVSSQHPNQFQPQTVAQLCQNFSSQLVELAFDPVEESFSSHQGGLFQGWEEYSDTRQMRIRYIIPTNDFSQSKGEFEQSYTHVFTCENPGHGPVTVIKPAEANPGGKLIRKGILRIGS